MLIVLLFFIYIHQFPGLLRHLLSTIGDESGPWTIYFIRHAILDVMTRRNILCTFLPVYVLITRGRRSTWNGHESCPPRRCLWTVAVRHHTPTTSLSHPSCSATVALNWATFIPVQPSTGSCGAYSPTFYLITFIIIGVLNDGHLGPFCEYRLLGQSMGPLNALPQSDTQPPKCLVLSHDIRLATFV